MMNELKEWLENKILGIDLKNSYDNGILQGYEEVSNKIEVIELNKEPNYKNMWEELRAYSIDNIQANEYGVNDYNNADHEDCVVSTRSYNEVLEEMKDLEEKYIKGDLI